MTIHRFGEERTTIREIDRYVSIDRTSARQLVKRRRKATINDKANDDDYDDSERKREKEKAREKKSNYCHETRTRASRFFVTRLCVQVEKKKKKKEKNEEQNEY